METKKRKTDRQGRLTLFKDFADHLVIIERVGKDELRIRKAQAVTPRVSLSKIMENVTNENLHSEIDAGPAVGGEAW